MMKRSGRGFTMIELMVVIAVIGLLVAVAVPTYQHSIRKAREAVLKENLFILRQTIDQYFADKGYYPQSLEVLVDEGYLRKMPIDPFTGQADWEGIPAESGVSLDPNEPGGIWDVRSRSSGVTLEGESYDEL
jgi:general secretion pathway protein G